MIALGGQSRQSLASLRGTLDEKLKALSASECATISRELFNVLSSVTSSTALRRALTDPSRDGAAKSALISDLYGSTISSNTKALLEAVVLCRWSTPVDLASGIEQLAIESEATAATLEGALDLLQEELFAFQSLIVANDDLRNALALTGVEASFKSELLNSLFSGKTNASTLRLVISMIGALNGRNLELVADLYIQTVAARRNRAIATVRTRSPLTQSQSERLTAVLTKQVGQPIHLNVEVDPAVLGGISVRFQDEIIDGTISTRVAEAGQALAI